ncbi:MAG: glycerol kinase, partial [Marinobacter sp.]
DRPALVETTAVGVAYLAGLQAGVYKTLDDLSSMWRCDRSFEAVMSKAQRDKLYDGWVAAVRRL